jgi:hypothetical protein
VGAMFSKECSMYNKPSTQAVHFHRLMNRCWFGLILADSETSLYLPPIAGVIRPSPLLIKHPAMMKRISPQPPPRVLMSGRSVYSLLAT